MIRVTIFDDNQHVRNAMQMLIEFTEGYAFAGAFENCNLLSAHIKSTQPDVIVMDIDMPGISGIEAVKQIRHEFPGIQILMLTSFDDDEKVFNSILAGAAGYVLKNTPPAKILEYITEVYNGGAPMTPAIARKVLQLFSKNVIQAVEKETYNLSIRENEVLAALVKGKSYKMIADELSITYDTVRARMKKIYEKLHVNSLTEVVAKALKERLV